MSVIPAGPFEHDPIEASRALSILQVRQLLTRITEWLQAQDQPTIITGASLLFRALAHQGEQ